MAKHVTITPTTTNAKAAQRLRMQASLQLSQARRVTFAMHQRVSLHIACTCGRSASAADPRLGTRETLRVLEQLVSELLGRAQRHLPRVQ